MLFRNSHEFFVTVSVTNLVLLLTECSTAAHAVIPLELILLASPRTHSILWIDLEMLTSITIPVQFIDEPMAIDYDPVDNRVYWIDKERQEIWSAFLNGTDTRLLPGWGLNTVLEDIALDATSRLLFFSDSGQGLIGLLSISAFDQNQLSLLNASKPRQLALDPGNGVIFWIDLNINVKINRVNYDGNDNRAIVINDLVHPTAISLDIENGYLYWVDPGKNTVEFTNMEGQHRSTFKSPYQSHFVALAFLANQLYVVDIYNSAITNTTAVWRVVNANGTFVFTTPILLVPGDVTDIVIYSAREKETGSMSVSNTGFYSALIGGLVGCCLGIISVITAVYIIVHMKRKGRTPSHNIQFRKASNLVFNPSAMTAAERNTISYISFHRDSEILPELQGTVLQPPLSASSDNGNLNLGNHTFRKSRGVSRTEPVSITRVNGGDVREDTTGNVNDSSQTDTVIEEADVRTDHVKHPVFYCRL